MVNMINSGIHTLLTKRRASHFFDEKWYNFEFDELDNARELSHIAVDPQNSNRVMISSYFDGILEFVDNELINHYDSQNSNMEGVPSNANDVRVGASVFTQQGIYILQIPCLLILQRK